MSLQRQHFLLSCLKTLSVGPAGVEPALSELSLLGGGEKYRDIITAFYFLDYESTDLLDFKNTWHFEESPINLCSQFKLLRSRKIQVITQY